MSSVLRDVVSAAGLGALIGLAAGFAFGFIGWVMWLVLDLTEGVADRDHLPVSGFFIGLGIGGVVFLVGLVSAMGQPSRDAAAQRAAAEEARIRQVEASHQRTLTQLRTVDQISEAAVAQFEALPHHLETAEGWLTDAIARLQEPSFSPFWEAIENSYVALGQYRACLEAIRQHAARYFEVVRDSHLDGLDVPGFPISVDDAEATMAANSVERRLATCVAEAHRDHRFSSIYEQRRSTDAIVAGFRGLHGAIAGMRASLVGSLQAVRDELESGHARLDRSIATGATVTAQAVEGAAARAGAEGKAAHRELVRRVDRSTEELRRLRTW